jgi:hypothetical protein
MRLATWRLEYTSAGRALSRSCRRPLRDEAGRGVGRERRFLCTLDGSTRLTTARDGATATYSASSRRGRLRLHDHEYY